MIGQTIGHYRIVKKIAFGGMGNVFLADGTKLERGGELPEGIKRMAAAPPVMRASSAQSRSRSATRVIA